MPLNNGGSSNQASSGGRHTVLLLTVLLLVLASISLYGLVRPSGRVEVPDVVLGKWTTTAQRYADKSFTVRKDSLVLYVSESDSTVHAIEGVEVEDLGGPLLLTVHYWDVEGLTEFPFYYDTMRGGVVRFKNQRAMEWKRET